MWFNRKKNILVTGAKGQLGSYLVDNLLKLSFKQASIVGKVFGIDIDDLDLTNSFDVADFFNKEVVDPSVKIDYVVHCAAATDTAAIEKDPLKFYASNVIATKNLAESCAYNGIKLIHISTDYVMSELSPEGCGGDKIEFPVNQYGLQKLLAEKEAQIAYMKSGHPERLTIGRLSWLFGNSKNSFVEKFLRSAFKTYVNAKNNGIDGDICHKVVNDAYGRPTPVWLVLADVLDVICRGKSGIHDFQYTMHGQISRFAWAKMILSAFYNELKKYKSFCCDENNEKITNAVADMKERLKIIEVDSQSLGLGMRHPGLVDCEANSIAIDVYTECTEKYIENNARQLVDMMLNELKEVK